MIETLFGGVIGGLFRLAPEVLKFFDRAGERKHELALLENQMKLIEIRGKIDMAKTEAEMVMAEMDAISVATDEQGKTARAAGKWVAAISALVRPTVTYAFVIVYFLVKFAAYMLALEQNGEWKQVLVTMWNKDDMAMLMLLLTFWFTGRVLERNRAV